MIGFVNNAKNVVGTRYVHTALEKIIANVVPGHLFVSMVCGDTFVVYAKEKEYVSMIESVNSVKIVDQTSIVNMVFVNMFAYPAKVQVYANIKKYVDNVLPAVDHSCVLII